MSPSHLPPTRPARPQHPDGIAVFGSSEPRPGQPAYTTALELGTLLARAGHTVVTGGYGGVMEAASRGAQEARGRTVGVTTAIFGDRAPNRWLSDVIPTADLYERTRQLVDRSRGFIVLPGKAGTLAEIAWLWALDRAGCLDQRPMVLLGEPWPLVVELLERKAMLDPRQLQRTRLATSPADAVSLLGRLLDCGER